MNPAFSGALDLLRILAAGVVFASHAALYGPGPHDPLQGWAHDGVIAFFVLSGYLVTYSASERERSWAAYALARAARIYSVALPALALTLALDYVGLQMRPDLYRAYQYENVLFYFPYFVAFGSDLWFMAEDAFSNVPFWSLCYEVWYYVLFGAAAFGRGRARLLLVGLVLLITGPKLWLLLPLWALGSWLYRLHGRVRLPEARARALLLAAIAAYAAVKAWGLDDALDSRVNAWLGGFPDAWLRYSRWFLGDYLIGAAIGLAIFAARDAGLAWLGAPLVRRSLGQAASCTFTLYALHYPLLLFFSILFRHEPDSTAGLLLLIAATVVVVLAVASVTERRKDAFRRAILAALAPLAAVRRTASD